MDDDALTELLCTWLDAAGVGTWLPDAGTIFYGAIPEDAEAACGVTVYATTDDVEIGTATRYVQVRYRGARDDVRGANRLADAGFEALQGVHHRDGIARARRVSSAHLGADANGRQERTDNYQIILSPLPEVASP